MSFVAEDIGCARHIRETYRQYSVSREHLLPCGHRRFLYGRKSGVEAHWLVKRRVSVCLSASNPTTITKQVAVAVAVLVGSSPSSHLAGVIHRLDLGVVDIIRTCRYLFFFNIALSEIRVEGLHHTLLSLCCQASFGTIRNPSEWCSCRGI